MQHETDRYVQKSRETLKKVEILRGYRSFQRVFQDGKKITGKYINIFCLSNSNREVGFAVSRQYRKAVERNRMKRIMKELYRKNKDSFPYGKLILFGKYFHPLPSMRDLLLDLEQMLGQKIQI